MTRPRILAAILVFVLVGAARMASASADEVDDQRFAEVLAEKTARSDAHATGPKQRVNIGLAPAPEPTAPVRPLQPLPTFTPDGWTVAPQCGSIVVTNGTGVAQWVQVVNGRQQPLGIPQRPLLEAGSSYTFGVANADADWRYAMYATADPGGWGMVMVTMLDYVDC